MVVFFFFIEIGIWINLRFDIMTEEITDDRKSHGLIGAIIEETVVSAMQEDQGFVLNRDLRENLARGFILNDLIACTMKNQNRAFYL